MKSIHLTIFCSLISLLSCKGEGKLGNLDVNGISGICFELHQERDFDSATAIDYQIFREGSTPITPRKFLLGTTSYEIDTKNFYAECIDSIIYLTYNSKTEVFALYDLRSNIGYPNLENDWKKSFENAERLLLKLKKTKPELTGEWKK
jgi:hypothetical protein